MAVRGEKAGTRISNVTKPGSRMPITRSAPITSTLTQRRAVLALL